MKFATLFLFFAVALVALSSFVSAEPEPEPAGETAVAGDKKVPKSPDAAVAGKKAGSAKNTDTAKNTATVKKDKKNAAKKSGKKATIKKTKKQIVKKPAPSA